MWRNILFISVLIGTLFISQSRTEAATAITVSGANKVYSYTMVRNATLSTIVSGAPTQLFVESAKQYAVFFRAAPTDLRTIYTTLEARIFVDHADRQLVPVLMRAPATLQAIYTTLEARIFVDHADRQFVPVLTQAPTTLQAIYTTLAARIFVDHADAQFVPVLVPIILDNGVPTGTVARGATQPDQTPRPSMTSTPTATPSVEARVAPSDSPVPTITAHDVATMTIEPTTAIALTTTVEPSATPQP